MDTSKPFGTRGPGDQDDPAGRSAAGGADARALEVAVNAGEVHQKREGAGSAGVALICEQRYARTAFTIRQTSWRSPGR